MPSRTALAGDEANLSQQRKRSRQVLEDNDGAEMKEERTEVVEVSETNSFVQPSSTTNQRAKRARNSGSKAVHFGPPTILGGTESDGQLHFSEDEGSRGPRSTSEQNDMDEDDISGIRDNNSGHDYDINDDDDDSPLLPATQYEIMRDKGFKHLQHEEHDDMIATQRLQRRAAHTATLAANLSGENRHAQNGIIERVTCVNFMCHTRLECELGPLLNFIVGENGSGKSAILTAITLCLGAKASATNRGASLKNFIKQGEERGFLAVRIKNSGGDAYEHDVYGDSIIVERHFSKTGTSSFKLKSSTERLISTKRADVDDIVEYYYLQVDNPLNILSQDNARQFLNSSSASLKYKYFMQGVQLEQLDRDYELVKQFLDAHREKLPQMGERLDMLKKNCEEAERLHRAVLDNQDMRRKRRLYTRQLAWSQVVEQEAVMEEHDRAIAEADKAVANSELERAVASQKLELQDEKLRRAEESLARLKTEEETHKDRVERATEKHDEAVAQLRVLHNDERDIHSNLKRCAERIKNFKSKISDEQQRLEDANGDLHRETQKRLVAAKKRREEIQTDVANEAARLSDLGQSLAAAQSETHDKGLDVSRKRTEVRNRESQIRSLQQSRGTSSPYDAFDPRMAELVSLVEHNDRFSRKPIGPLGAKIRVQKPVWGPIMERTFGSALNGFVVTSHDDQQRLSGMIRQLGMNGVPVFIANSRPINTAGKEPDAQFDTISRILEFDDPLIRDQLIISNYIEQVILVQDRKRAEQIMFNGPAPANVSACLALHDKKRGEGLRLTSRGAGNVSTTPVVPNLGQKPRMKTDLDSQIAVQRDILAQGQGELDRLQTELDALKREEQRCANESKASVRRQETLRKALRAANVAIEQIEEELDKFDGADGRLRNLERELEADKKQKEQLGEQYGDANIRKTEQSEEVERLKKLLEIEKADYREFRTKIDKATRTVEKHQDARRVALVAKNEAFEKVDLLKQQKEEAERKRERQAARVEEFTSQAKLVSATRADIPEGETYASVEKKMEALVKLLEARQAKLGMSDEEVSNRAAETKTAYMRFRLIYRTSRKHVNAIEEALILRLKKWRRIQRHISALSRTNFIYLLSERGYRGRMLIDHKHKKLQVQVEPDETRHSVSGRDTRTLSGGEKSFSSICLLLSIWEAMGSPLRCLDEFDVFMDNVNRDVSTNMLVDAARRSVGRQYIFITPNAIQGQARHAPDVRIIRLTDPRQGTLDRA